MEDVANNDSISKSVTFEDILKNETGSSITRQQLTAIVGNDVTAETNIGFNELLIGLKEGQSIFGYPVLKSEGYGEKNYSLIEIIPFLDKIPMYQTYDRNEFEALYPEEVPLLTNQVIKDRYWDWIVRVESITDDTVVIKHEPEIGMELGVFNWPTTVVNISSSTGLIWLRHNPDDSNTNTPIDLEVLEFYNPRFTEIKESIINTQQPYPGIILSISNGIEIDFNRENIGKNLKYDITIVEIERD
jgi:FKBP-type peptidyl-prolyl cis-trans isomerase 2